MFDPVSPGSLRESAGFPELRPLASAFDHGPEPGSITKPAQEEAQGTLWKRRGTTTLRAVTKRRSEPQHGGSGRRSQDLSRHTG